jgi:hypothetical protein
MPINAPTSASLDAARAGVAAIANGYDSDGELAASALRALARRLATSGKECSRCRQFKRLAHFSRDAREHDGLRRYCRDCAAIEYRARREHSA